MRFARTVGLLMTVVLVAAACSSGDGDGDGDEVRGADSAAPVAPSSTVVTNQGGSLEGHTPRGFAGMGTGLFAGDNLNPSFPEGDGVQLFLTFELPDRAADTGPVILRSDALHVQGTPFDDLGTLGAARVAYSEFGPHLFDLAPTGEAVGCVQTGSSSIECDVTAAVLDAVAAGDGRVQFRLRFDQAGDRDGSGDLAMFFLADSNTNEPGIFELAFG